MTRALPVNPSDTLMEQAFVGQLYLLHIGSEIKELIDEPDNLIWKNYLDKLGVLNDDEIDTVIHFHEAIREQMQIMRTILEEKNNVKNKK